MEVILDGAVWDIQAGLILKVGEGKVVTQALSGLKRLGYGQITTLYGEKPIFTPLDWPLITRVLDKEEGAHWVL